MQVLIYVVIIIATVIAMEFIAWLAHKYIMHGFLWSWHEDHHKPHYEKVGFFEKNDLFFLVFAIPSAGCYMAGTFWEATHFLLYIGIGISIYGLIYFLIHDVYIHQRFKWFKQLDSKYSKAILKAHGAHHSKQDKYDGVSFGLLSVDKKYYQKLTKSAK